MDGLLEALRHHDFNQRLEAELGITGLEAAPAAPDAEA
jgi:hypothetical protein